MSAWAAHVEKVVTKGGEFPEPDTSPVAVDETRSLFRSIGGGAVLGDEDRDDCNGVRLPVSVTVGDSESWVVVRADGKVVAMSLDEAFRRGLQELSDW